MFGTAAPTTLVHAPGATNFMSNAATHTGRKIALGDQSTAPASVANEIGVAHAALENGVKKIAALVQDETRTEVAKHEAAKQVADNTIAVFNRTKAAITARGVKNSQEAVALAEREFGPQANRSSLEMEARRWIRDQAGKVDGPAKIRHVLKTNKDVAAVIYHSPPEFLELAGSLHEDMKAEAVMSHLPEAVALFEELGALAALQPKYDKAIAAVRRSFYSSAIADRARTRVEV